MQLTPKEASLLKDLKGQEQLCVDKYNRHAASANDPQLKNLFEQIAQVEQQHLDAITQMEGGTVAAPADSATVPTTFKTLCPHEVFCDVQFSLPFPSRKVS